MNKIILIGNISTDIEIRYTTSNVATAQFNLAVQGNFKDDKGEYRTDFIKCVAWRNQAENLSKYCEKGSKIAVDGKLQNRSYEGKDGTKKYITEVIADNITFLNTKPKGEVKEETREKEKALEPEGNPFEEFANENADELGNLPFDYE